MLIVIVEILIVVIVEVIRKFSEDEVMCFMRDVLINLFIFWIFFIISFKEKDIYYYLGIKLFIFIIYGLFIKFLCLRYLF